MDVGMGKGRLRLEIKNFLGSVKRRGMRNRNGSWRKSEMGMINEGMRIGDVRYL